MTIALSPFVTYVPFFNGANLVPRRALAQLDDNGPNSSKEDAARLLAAYEM